MNKITYILGAGASCNALPLNSNLIKQISNFLTIGRNHPMSEINQFYLKIFEDKFYPIIELASRESSIDTLAKVKINSELYYSIKNLLWIYFSAVAGRGKLDKRYKNLLIKLKAGSSKSFRINENFNFITWNYDLQLEEALSEIDNESISNIPHKFYSYPGIGFTSSNKLIGKINSEFYSIIHLNGCAGYYYNNSENKYNTWYNCDLTNPMEYNDLLRLVIQNFYTNISENRPNLNSISFAFEKNNFSKQALYHSKMIAADTTHLVVIGYSFPDFNREIDRLILNKMEKLEYICIQNKEANKLLNKIADISENIKNKISKMNLKTYLEEDLEEFHLPFHL